VHLCPKPKSYLNFIGFKIKLSEHSSSGKELKVFKRIDPFFTGNNTGYISENVKVVQQHAD
jgi:hypothetical protein